MNPGQKLHLWNREECCRGEEAKIDKSKVKLVRQRFWKDKNGNNVEGCVVEMQEGAEQTEYGLAEVASIARRTLEVITRQPAGSAPQRIDKDDED